jgi:hypothetical protein
MNAATVPMTLPANRRAQVRAPLSGTVTLTARGRIVDAAALDVSAGGLRVIAHLGLVPGERVSSVFFVDGEIVSAEGRVRWAGRTKLGFATFGLHFDTIDHEGHMALTEYCRRAIS